MLTHLGFSAWIVCDGQPLSEYLVAVDPETNCVSCWIPGTPGHKFTVFWQDHDGGIDSCAYINLDGILVPGKFLYGHGVAARSGARVSKTAERPFVFQTISDQALAESTSGQAKDAGIIKLKIKRVTRVATRYANPVQPLPDNPSVLGKRKAGDLCVGFGEEETSWSQSQATWHVLPYPCDKDTPPNTKPSTYVSFVFRYRSLDFLETQGIASEATKWNQPVTMPMQPSAGLPPPIPRQADEGTKRAAKKPRLSGHGQSAEASTSRAASGHRIASSSATPETPNPIYSTASTPALMGSNFANAMTSPAAFMGSNFTTTMSPHPYVFGDAGLPAQTTSSASASVSSPAVASSSDNNAIAGPSKPRLPSKSKARPPPKPRVTSKPRVPSASSVASTSRVAFASRTPSTTMRMFPTESRRASAEIKRIVSWTGPTPATLTLAGGYQGEAQFFIPHNPTNYMLSAPNDSSDTSESATTPPDPTSPAF